MKALSIRPHWAWAIIQAGKDIENRTWKANSRGPLAIHASKNSNRRDYEWALRYIQRISPRAKVPAYEQLVRGAIIGTVEIVACEKRTKSKWHIRGNYGFVLRNPRAFRMPLPCSGRLGLWEVASSLTRRVASELRRSY